MNIQNKQELQQIAFNNSSDIMNLYKKCAKKPYSFLVIDATFISENPLRLGRIFQKTNKN